MEIGVGRFQAFGLPALSVQLVFEKNVSILKLMAEKRTPGPAEQSTQFSFVFHNNLPYSPLNNNGSR